MTEFDHKAELTIQNLSKQFDINPLELKSINVPFTVGIEIEVKFKYYFPELHEKHFKDYKWKYLSYEDQEKLTNEISIIEQPLKNSLQQTIECGVPKGNDKYWEFAFNPVNDLSLLVNQIYILRKAGLIPPGRHSLHITICGSKWYNGTSKKVNPYFYYTLMALELLFSDKQRIAEGFSFDQLSNASWANKGMGGIFEKNDHELIDSVAGCELRSLILKDDTDLQKLFEFIKFVMTESEGELLLEDLKAKMLKIGLPNKNWKRPSINPNIWKLYIEEFDNLSFEFKKILYENCLH